MYRIGIDLGGTNVAVGIVDNDNKIVIKGSVPTDAKRHPDYIIKDMALLCEKLLKDANILLCQIEMVGIASPGAVDSKRGIITYAGNINMIDYPIAEKLYERHTVLTNTLIALGVPEEIASEDACKIEHFISEETFDAI